MKDKTTNPLNPNWKSDFNTFLMDNTPLYVQEDFDIITDYVEKNFVKDRSKLTAALAQSVEIIKQLITKAAKNSGISKEIIEEIWLSYYENSEDMEGIREVLKEK